MRLGGYGWEQGDGYRRKKDKKGREGREGGISHLNWVVGCPCVCMLQIFAA